VHTLTITPPSLDDLFLEQYRADAPRPVEEVPAR
jgi:hypothetical protein